jgi:O-antigen ligase
LLNKIKSWYETSKRLKFIGLLLFAVIITFQPVFFAPTYIIAFFWFFYLLSFKPERLTRLKNNFWFWWFFAFYVWYIIGASYSVNSPEAWRLIVLKITLFLWPLAFGSLSKLSLKHLKMVLYAFVLAMFVSSFVCVILSFVDYLELRDWNRLFGNDLAQWRFLPNHYFGMYTSFAILILAFDLLQANAREDSFKTAKILLLVYFSIFLIMLSVRIQLVALPIALFVLFFTSDVGRSQKVKFVRIGLSSLVLFAIAVAVFPDSRRRVIETAHEIRSFEKVVDNKQTNHRVYIWREGVEVIKEDVLIGKGTGSEDQYLAKRLDKIDARFWDGSNVYFLSRGGYNYHNQFLQGFASSGVLGLIFIVGMFGISLYHSIRKRQGLVSAWLALCLISFSTESMLERQAGVMFFGFFFGLLIINQLPSNEKQNPI